MDLTKITTPYGLLDEATQKALRECGGPWEYYSSAEWLEMQEADFTPVHWVFRQKPQPPKPREWWIVDGFNFDTRVEAIEWTTRYYDGQPVIHVREVVE